MFCCWSVRIWYGEWRNELSVKRIVEKCEEIIDGDREGRGSTR